MPRVKKMTLLLKRWGREPILLWVLILGLLVACGGNSASVESTPATPSVPVDTLHLLWVNSYSDNDLRSIQVQSGITEALVADGYSTDEGTLDWEIVHLDIKKYATDADILSMTGTAVAAIEADQPDVVIVSDNEAIRALVSDYPDPNQLFVYCGLKGNPKDYNLNRPNVTGILEVPYPVQTFEIALAFVPDARRYMILSDDSVSSMDVTLRVYEELKQKYPDFQLALRVTENWLGWQETVLKAADVDFILLVSSEYVWDNHGGYVEQDELMAWMLENSPVPVFAMSNLAVVNGAVAGLISSGYEQGLAAGQIAVRIARGAHPSSIQASAPSRNRLVMNLASARHWNLSIPIAFPLAAHVYRTLPGEPGGR